MPNDTEQMPPKHPEEAASADGPPEGPGIFDVTTDIELPAEYWDILNGKVKITLRR